MSTPKKDRERVFEDGVALFGVEEFKNMRVTDFWQGELVDLSDIETKIESATEKLATSINSVLAEILNEQTSGAFTREALLAYLPGVTFDLRIIDNNAIVRCNVTPDGEFGVDLLLDDLIEKDIAVFDYRSEVAFWRDKFAEYVAICDQRLADGTLVEDEQQ